MFIIAHVLEGESFGVFDLVMYEGSVFELGDECVVDGEC